MFLPKLFILTLILVEMAIRRLLITYKKWVNLSDQAYQSNGRSPTILMASSLPLSCKRRVGCPCIWQQSIYSEFLDLGRPLNTRSFNTYKGPISLLDCEEWQSLNIVGGHVMTVRNNGLKRWPEELCQLNGSTRLGKTFPLHSPFSYIAIAPTSHRHPWIHRHPRWLYVQHSTVTHSTVGRRE